MHDVLLKPSPISVARRLICLTAAVSKVVQVVALQVDKCMSLHSIRVIKEEVPAEGLKTTTGTVVDADAAATAKNTHFTLSIGQTLTQAVLLGCIHTKGGKVWPVVGPLVAQALSKTVGYLCQF